ncbi:MAG: single-stranded DNA-binding protein [Oscillospiraceae bacterium]|nr:single-stranded DNA-binding protein [Oscillospiraceae bacterium]
MAWQNNTAALCGRMDAPAAFSHRSRGVDYYIFPLVTRRLSGTADRLNVILGEDEARTLPEGGQRLGIEGEVRSFNNRGGEGNRLQLYVFAQNLVPAGDDCNTVLLSGILCRPPVWRRTPMGREICDLMLAVPRRYGRTDYLPCIAWGRTARDAAAWEQGRPVRLTGRFQSRNYIKVTETGSVQRTAFEISVTEFLPTEG